MSAPGFSREGSADSPQASARGLLNGRPIAKQPSLLQRLRSGNKSKMTTSGNFNVPQDLREVMAVNTQKGPAEDPLRITISKYDKKHWHQPPPEDNLAPETPDAAQRMSGTLPMGGTLPPGNPLSSTMMGRTLGGTMLSQTGSLTPTSQGPSKGHTRSMDTGRFPVPEDLRAIIAANSPRKKQVDADFAHERASAHERLYSTYGSTPQPSLANTANFGAPMGSSLPLSGTWNTGGRDAPQDLDATSNTQAHMSKFVYASVRRIAELEGQCRQLREELATVVGQDNMMQAMDEFASHNALAATSSGHALDL